MFHLFTFLSEKNHFVRSMRFLTLTARRRCVTSPLLPCFSRGKFLFCPRQASLIPSASSMSRNSVPRITPSRKKQHIDVTLTRDVRFRKKTTGLEHLEFVNNALPELDFSEVD